MKREILKFKLANMDLEQKQKYRKVLEHNLKQSQYSSTMRIKGGSILAFIFGMGTYHNYGNFNLIVFILALAVLIYSIFHLKKKYKHKKNV